MEPNKNGTWAIFGDSEETDMHGVSRMPFLCYVYGEYKFVQEYAKTLKGWTNYNPEKGGRIDFLYGHLIENLPVLCDTSFSTVKLTSVRDITNWRSDEQLILIKKREDLKKQIKEIDTQLSP